MLVCLQLSVLMISANFPVCNNGFINFILLYLGDFLHQFVVWVLIFSLIACHTADMLVGSDWWRNRGSLSMGLDLNSAASLASLSASSLPMESLWPATQVNEILASAGVGWSALVWRP